MQKWLLTIIIAILPVITACSKTDTEVSVPEEETGKKVVSPLNAKSIHSLKSDDKQDDSEDITPQ